MQDVDPPNAVSKCFLSQLEKSAQAGKRYCVALEQIALFFGRCLVSAGHALPGEGCGGGAV